MKKENTIDKAAPLPKEAEETLQPDVKDTEPVTLDAKALARQRSKDDLARKRRDMHQKRGKR